MSGLKWRNLKNNKCPNCNRALTAHGDRVICDNNLCDFTISADRMQEIVASVAERDLEEDQEHYRDEGWG